MKKGFLISLVAASLLSVAQAADYGRMNSGFTGMMDIQEHAQEAKSSAHSVGMNMNHDIDSNSDSDTDYDNDAYSSAMSQASSAHSAGMNMNHDTDNDNDSDNDTDYDNDAKKHAQEAKSSAHSEGMGFAQEAYSSAMAQASSAFSNGMKHGEDAYSSAMAQASSAHSEAMAHKESNATMPTDHEPHKGLLALVEGQIPTNLPPQAKNALKEARKAIKFAKHPELFADLNITDPTQLTPEMIEKIKEKAQKAFQERSEEIAQKLIGHKPKVQLPIAGDFVRIGSGQYDWAFVTKSGHVYKLAGVNENGQFKYEPLSGVQGQIAPDGKVSFDGQNPSVTLPGTPTTGYPFAKYNDPNENGFDWIVATKSGHIYKLEGFDEESKSFVYTPVEGVKAKQQGEEVEVLPGS